MLGNHLATLTGLGPNLLEGEKESVGRLTIEMIRTFLPAQLNPSYPIANGEASLKARITYFIEQNLDDEMLNNQVIFRKFGLSRASLYRQFSSRGGVANYIRGRRLEKVMAEITGGNREPIHVIARRFGFSNEATFGRAFKTRYKLSPTMARREAERCRSTAGIGERSAAAMSAEGQSAANMPGHSVLAEKTD